MSTRFFLLAGLLCTLAMGVSAAGCNEYAQQLAQMRVADQSLREFHLQSSVIPQRLGRASGVIDRGNTGRLKVLLNRCGWPVASKYGMQASTDAWLLVQHADGDRKFQHQALALLERAVQMGEARGGDLAYLSDRLAVSEGRIQLYGTQFTGIENCRLVLAPIDTREAVNERRRAVAGMPSLEEYEEYANAHTLSECR